MVSDNEEEQTRVQLALNAVQNAILQQTIRLANSRKHANTPTALIMLTGLEAQLLREYSRLIRLRHHADERFHGGKASREKCCAFISWLQVVNVTSDAAQLLATKIQDLNQILGLSDDDLFDICRLCELTESDRRKFVQATGNLRNYTNRWKELTNEPAAEFSDAELSWGGLETGPLGNARRSVSESGVDSGASDSGVGSNVSQNSLPTTTPPPSPGYAMAYVSASGRSMPHSATGGHLLGVTHLQQAPSGRGKSKVGGGGSPTTQDSYRAATSRDKEGKIATPPLNHKYTSAQDPFGMTRSKSEEANLAVRLNKKLINEQPSKPLLKPEMLNVSRSMHESLSGVDDAWSQSWPNNWLTSPDEPIFSPTSPHPDKFLIDSAFEVDLRSPSASVSVPRSPHARRLEHHIPHQWYSKKFSVSTCEVCKNRLGVKGEKCRSCKVKVHTDCKAKLGIDTCGLTSDHVKNMINILFPKNEMWGDRTLDHPPEMLTSSRSEYILNAANKEQYETINRHKLTPDHFPSSYDMGSSSSTNSSAPQTPANDGGPHPSSANLHKAQTKFNFPGVDETPEVPMIVESDPNGECLSASNKLSLLSSTGSDRTVTGNGSQGGCSHATDSTLSQEDVAALCDSMGSSGQTEEGFTWSRERWPTLRGQTTSWKDVTIPYHQITFPKDSLIGTGYFGEVHRGYWHMDVAVKLLNMDHVDVDRQLEAFKKEVVSFKNTRHENIVLFIGYCLDPPKLGIVMNLCKGKTLHSIIHHGRDRLDPNRVMHIATQITQGMSYLHGKNILHKDLRSKNIFVESNQKVVITDFGLFSIQRLKNHAGNQLCSIKVPEHWLCYLAPELIRLLAFTVDPHFTTELPFTISSDVYAFGSVWYELLSGEFPFKRQLADSIVWQVGRGIKPALNNILVPKEMKDILMHCWLFNPDGRPDFNDLFKTLERLPRKRLARSPSHPVSMSRSAESIF